MAAAVDEDAVDWDEPLEGSMVNVLEHDSLKWIFVGGKGGVGKTTTSCSLAVALAKQRDSVLLISTDPAHNLSDAFGQKIGKAPTPIEGVANLAAMEIDPTVEVDTGDALDSSSKSLLSEMASSIPGIDEAMSFAELMKHVQSMDYSCIVFDTAPTGHTLRLLSFPTVLTKAFDKIVQLRSRFEGIFAQFRSVMEQTGTTEEQLLARLDRTKATIAEVNRQFQDPDLTTFVCVCIPEFLSLYETERLVQELTKFGIDTHNIVVNQVLMPEQGSSCRKCAARVRMQGKYLSQIADLYEEFHVTTLPLLDEEVRGREALDAFGRSLMNPPQREDDDE